MISAFSGLPVLVCIGAEACPVERLYTPSHLTMLGTEWMMQ
jgi:hypothetical protein